MEPAIRHASRGFAATPYLHECVADGARDMLHDKPISAIYLPGGTPIKAGERVVQRTMPRRCAISRARRGGAVSRRARRHPGRPHEAHGGFISRDDLTRYRTVERAPLRADYRGFDILGPPPPSASGVHIIQMLNILEGYDIAALGFGTPETMHLLAEVLKIAFADRAAATADPAFVKVPVERLTRRPMPPSAARDRFGRAQAWSAGVVAARRRAHHAPDGGRCDRQHRRDHADHQHPVRRLDLIPGLGTVPNNYMFVFDPRPGHALSIAPGKRVTSSMSPVMVLRDGKLVYALGLPGGMRIFPSVMQALFNLIDHGMSVQEAVEAPRIWTEGNALEVEQAVPGSRSRASCGDGPRGAWRCRPWPAA